MYVILALVLSVLALTVHELAHGLAMNHCGVQIQAFGLGMPFPRWLTLSLSLGESRPELRLNPLVLGAYVIPTEAGAKRIFSLEFSRRAIICGSGPLASFAFALLLFVVVDVSRGYTSVLTLISGGVILLACTLQVRFFTTVLPILGFLALIYIVYSVATSPESESMGGPVLIWILIKQAAENWEGAVRIAAVLSFLWGMTNLVPLPPLDGGGIVVAGLESRGYRRAAMWLRGVGLGVFVVTLIVVLQNDLDRLLF